MDVGREGADVRNNNCQGPKYRRHLADTAGVVVRIAQARGSSELAPVGSRFPIRIVMAGAMRFRVIHYQGDVGDEYSDANSQVDQAHETT
jgi:hypothetical protein